MSGTETPVPKEPIHYIHYSLPPYSTPLLILWSVLTAAISLTGNTIVLIGTIRHDAIKLDKVSKLLIKHLAVSDIGNTLLVVLPSVFTLYTRRALFGDNQAVCVILSYVQYVFPTFDSVIVCLLMIFKLLFLLDPTKALTRTDTTGYILVSGAWICSLIPALMYLIVGGITPVFDTRDYRWVLVRVF